jgi:hypothetical protein
MSLRISAYLVEVPGIAPLYCPAEPSKVFEKNQLESAKQWARERALERGEGATITILHTNCVVWQLRAETKRESQKSHRERHGQE